MTFKKTDPLKGWKSPRYSVSTKGKLLGVIVNTDQNFVADGAWREVHDWWSRQLQGEKKTSHPGFLESEKSFRVTVEDRCG